MSGDLDGVIVEFINLTHNYMPVCAAEGAASAAVHAQAVAQQPAVGLQARLAARLIAVALPPPAPLQALVPMREHLKWWCEVEKNETIFIHTKRSKMHKLNHVKIGHIQRLCWYGNRYSRTRMTWTGWACLRGLDRRNSNWNWSGTGIWFSTASQIGNGVWDKDQERERERGW